MLSHITCFDMILYALNIMIALAHMLFYSLLCFLSNISAFGGYNHGHNRLTFVTDKTIKKILNNDRTEILKVELKENVERNDEASKFIWDKHIPKPLFHFIECQALMNADTETKLLLKCISNNDEEIFKFEIENKNGKLQDILFFDINGNRLNFSRRKDIGHEYFVSNREENIDSIRNSLKYMHRVKKLLPSCQVIIGKFDEFIKAVQSLRVETFKISDYDKNVVSKIWEVEKYVLRIMNTLLKTRATLSIPSLNKLEFIKSYDQFKKNMEELYDMIKTLKDTIDAEVSQHLKSGRGEKYEFQKDFDKHAEIILRDLKSVGFTSIDRKYRIFIKKLESINLLVQDIKGRNKVNSEITKDCDTKKVDKFFKKYSSCLLEYCDILDNCDEFFLNEHHYSKNSYTGSSDFTSLENAHDDILIAREMKKYLLNYQNDKTDFLIFSQTDYFKNKLSERIKINLKNTIFSIWLKHKFDRKITNDNNFKISNNDLNYIERIKILQKDLISVFNSEDSSTPQTFKKIIDSLECDQLQNDITSSRIDSDGKEQNTKHRKLEDQNQEYIQANEKSQLNEDQNQEFMQSSEESKMDENQNLNANKKDKTINENKLEENPMPLESNISKDEAKQVKSDISNGPNLQPKNSDDQEKGQESIKDIKFDDKNSKNNEKENDFTIHNDKQNIKDGSDQTTKEISSEKINESNMQINDQFMQNEAQDETLKENSDLDDSKKLINEKETKKDANPEENNKRTEENQDDESTFIDYNNIYFICGCVVVSSILGVSIFYFSSSQ